MHYAELARCWRAVDALLARGWPLGASTLFIENVGFSLAGASVSQSGANVVLRGAPSILRKRSILSKRQCEHCRSCCVYAVGLSIALYAVPVASSHRGGFKYAAHTPAAVCGWRPEQNLATAVPESVPVNVCVCGSLCVRFVIIFIDVTGSTELYQKKNIE